MVRDVARVGVPARDHGELWRGFEKWPLVMSYAVDDSDGASRGFFTLSKTVTGVLPALEYQWSQWDLWSVGAYVFSNSS